MFASYILFVKIQKEFDIDQEKISNFCSEIDPSFRVSIINAKVISYIADNKYRASLINNDINESFLFTSSNDHSKQSVSIYK